MAQVVRETPPLRSFGLETTATAAAPPAGTDELLSLARSEAHMPIAVRIAGAVLLLSVAGICAYLAVAAREAPPESWWAFWLIYGLVGIASGFGAIRLLRVGREPVRL